MCRRHIIMMSLYFKNLKLAQRLFGKQRTCGYNVLLFAKMSTQKKIYHKVQQTRNSAVIKMSPINPAQNRYMFGRRSKTQSDTGTSVYESGRRSVFGAATHRQVGARPSAAHRTGSERKSETRPAGVYERMCKKVIKLG